MKPEEAVAVRSVRDLPGHLQDDADALLTEYAEAMEDEGYPPEHVALDVALLLFKLAYFEPDVCPSLEAAQSGYVSGGWPWASVEEMRADMFDERGYARAYDLWRAEHGGGLPPA